MKHLASCIAFAATTTALAAQADTSRAEALDRYFALPAAKRADHQFPDALEAQLKSDADAMRRAVWAAIARHSKGSELHKDFTEHRVHNGKYLSPYTIKRVGKRPANGWPLFIAMHGGGGVAKRVNDSQWRHMQIYYRDQKAVEGYQYCALRAPTNAWNGFYTDYVYPLIANLIRQFVLFGDVDPDRVFLMGYSHGGYGAFAIGPKMPDRFAAVHSSAAAPTPGQSSAKTLRNTVFTFMVGDRDRAYGRASRCKAFAKQIAELRGDRKDIYPVTFELEMRHGHGGLPDRDKIKSMYPNIRKPAPKHLMWEQTDGVIRDFYWLRSDQPKAGHEVVARIDGNTVHVQSRGADAVTLTLDARLVDFAKPVTIMVDKTATPVRLTPRLAVLCDTMLRRGDPRLAGTAQHTVKLSE